MSLGIEALANDIERAQLHKAYSAAIDDMALSNAGNYAEKLALRDAVAKLDPDHPLLSESVHARLREGAKVVLARTKDWDKVADAGRNFQYDYTPRKSQRELQLEAEIARLKKALADLEGVNVQNYVEKHALRVALTRIDASHPMVWPRANESELIASLRKAGLTAYAYASAANPLTAYEAVAKVAEEFEYPLDYTRPRKNILESYQGETEAIRGRLNYLTDEENFRVFQRLLDRAKEQGSDRA